MIPKVAQAPDPSPEEVMGQLEKVLGSDLFVSAGRLVPFLRFVVETTLAGRSAELKESTIGVGVFGRAADYDPRTDPIVRVEARRLRSRLADYYGGPGRADPILIDLPKGAYVPRFISREPAGPLLPPVATRRERWRWLAVAALILIAAVTWRLARPARSGAPPASIAVLPFANIGAEPANEYFSDGLTDELIGALSRVPGLRVVGRSLAFQQKGRNPDVQDLGRQWNVGAVLEGSVRTAGGRIRITAQLTSTDDGYNLWSQTYDRQLSDVFGIQQEIALAITRSLRVKLAAGPAAFEPRRTNLEAYNHYLQGRYHINRYTKESFQLAFRSLEASIEADPEYAPAYAVLAQLYGLAGYYYLIPAAESWPKARAMAERALTLDPASAGAHAVMGFVLGMLEWKWPESEREFQRALELDPGSAEAYAAYGVGCLMPQARLEEAIEVFGRAIELDPLVVFPHMSRGFALLSAKRYQEAIQQYEKALELNPAFRDLWWDTGMAHAYAGNKEEAVRHFRKAREVAGLPLDDLGPGANVMLGDKEKALAQLERWEVRSVAEPEDYLHIARVYAMAGNLEKTMEWVEKAWSVREPQIVWLKMDPRFENVRQAPEFQAVLRRMGL